MQATRQAILDYLRAHGEATVRALAEHLGLTSTGVRQHLAVLEREGLVATRDLRGRVGRPALAYTLTETGERLYPKAYDRLSVALIEAIGSELDAGLYDQVVEAAAERLAAPLRERVSGPLHERVEAVACALRERAVLAEVSADEDGVTLCLRSCPYLEAAATTGATTCTLDRRALQLLTGAEVELVSALSRGDEACLFRLRPTVRTCSS